MAPKESKNISLNKELTRYFLIAYLIFLLHFLSLEFCKGWMGLISHKSYFPEIYWLIHHFLNIFWQIFDEIFCSNRICSKHLSYTIVLERRHGNILFLSLCRLLDSFLTKISHKKILQKYLMKFQNNMTNFCSFHLAGHWATESYQDCDLSFWWKPVGTVLWFGLACAKSG